MKHIFTSPSSAFSILKTHNMRSSNDKLYNMRWVKINHITYAAICVSLLFPYNSSINLYVIRLTLLSVHKTNSWILMWNSSYLTSTTGLQHLLLMKSLRIDSTTSMHTITVMIHPYSFLFLWLLILPTSSAHWLTCLHNRFLPSVSSDFFDSFPLTHMYFFAIPSHFISFHLLCHCSGTFRVSGI